MNTDTDVGLGTGIGLYANTDTGIRVAIPCNLRSGPLRNFMIERRLSFPGGVRNTLHGGRKLDTFTLGSLYPFLLSLMSARAVRARSL